MAFCGLFRYSNFHLLSASFVVLGVFCIEEALFFKNLSFCALSGVETYVKEHFGMDLYDSIKYKEEER